MNWASPFPSMRNAAPYSHILRKCAPRSVILLVPRVARYQGKSGPPYGLVRALVDEALDDRGNLPEAILLPPDREHLHAVDTLHVLSGSALPNFERLLGEFFGAREVSVDHGQLGFG